MDYFYKFQPQPYLFKNEYRHGIVYILYHVRNKNVAVSNESEVYTSRLSIET